MQGKAVYLSVKVIEDIELWIYTIFIELGETPISHSSPLFGILLGFKSYTTSQTSSPLERPHAVTMQKGSVFVIFTSNKRPTSLRAP